MRLLESIDIFPLILTLAAFRIGQLCQQKWKKPIFNPTLIGMMLVIAFLLATGMNTEGYTTGMRKMSWLMTPATICLAIPMYEQFQVLKKSLKAILAGVCAGALSCMLVVAAVGLLLEFEQSILISLLPKSVTTAIGVSLSELFGGMGGVTTAAIIVTGIGGNMMGPTLCKLFGITDPVAQGVAFGTSAHVIGTAKANEISELTGAASSLSLVVAGLLTAAFMPALAGLL
ncbi:MAG: LrgB family protein [Candidatus Faecousia sp.]|nr:LrgB family protein [Clostridiales bacterium]MCI6936883.1 LrgB family protein [Clostridiales bacterium]MDD5883871.1 LrgB family protein [Bacillota bacterium]MDY4598695.1 LrgB family protein [Candidatus Faecousia sp.]